MLAFKLRDGMTTLMPSLNLSYRATPIGGLFVFQRDPPFGKSVYRKMYFKINSNASTYISGVTFFALPVTVLRIT